MKIITGVKMMNLILVDTSVFLVIALRMDQTWLMDNRVTTNQVKHVNFDNLHMLFVKDLLYLMKYFILGHMLST